MAWIFLDRSEIEVTVVQTDASGLKIKIIFLPTNGKEQFEKEYGSGSESE